MHGFNFKDKPCQLFDGVYTSIETNPGGGTSIYDLMSTVENMCPIYPNYWPEPYDNPTINAEVRVYSDSALTTLVGSTGLAGSVGADLTNHVGASGDILYFVIVPVAYNPSGGSRRYSTLGLRAGPTEILFEDNFESGDLSKWSVDNDSDNIWHVGSAVKESGTYSCYITDGTETFTGSGILDAVYVSQNQDSHIFFDINIPSDATSLTLTFDALFVGEGMVYTHGWDYGYVMFKETSFTPVDGILYNSSTHVADRIGGHGTWRKYDDEHPNSSSSVWYSESITIDGTSGNGPRFSAGTTQRIIFSWTDDGSVEYDPAFCIDNVKVVYNT